MPKRTEAKMSVPNIMQPIVDRIAVSKPKLQAMCTDAANLDLDSAALLFDAAELIALGVQTVESSLSDWENATAPWADYHYHCYLCEDIQRAGSAFRGALLFLNGCAPGTHTRLDAAALAFLQRAITELDALDPIFTEDRQVSEKRRRDTEREGAHA